MSSACQKLAVTATTGMASTQLGMGATTLHHWCGIMNCRYSKQKLHELMVNDDKFAAARRRIMETDILFNFRLSLNYRECSSGQILLNNMHGDAKTFFIERQRPVPAPDTLSKLLSELFQTHKSYMYQHSMRYICFKNIEKLPSPSTCGTDVNIPAFCTVY